MNTENVGSVRVANSIIRQLVAEAAKKTDGVYKVHGYEKNLLDNKGRRAIQTHFTDEESYIEVYIVVDEGFNVIQTAENVQKAIAEELSSMLRIESNDIHVIVTSIHYNFQ